MKTYNIFISHAWRYSEHYDKVVQWLNEAQADHFLNWRNYSVPVHDPLIDPNSTSGKTKLKKALDAQIKPASVIIILAGMYSAHSDWIEFEIDKSLSYAKYIVGVKPWGQERIPVRVANNSDILIGWNKKSLISTITSNL